MTDEQLTELLIHPRFRSAVERIAYRVKTGGPIISRRPDRASTELEELAEANDWMSTHQVCRLFGVSIQSVFNAARKGHIERARRGYFTRASVLKYDELRKDPDRFEKYYGHHRSAINNAKANIPKGFVTIAQLADEHKLSVSRISQLMKAAEVEDGSPVEMQYHEMPSGKAMRIAHRQQFAAFMKTRKRRSVHN